MKTDSKIYIAGHTGLVGSAILKKLKDKGYKNIATRLHKELDLTRQDQVERFFKIEKPDYVFLCAAKVGGILSNMTYPAQFIYENITIAANVIHSSYLYGVKKMLFPGTACSYPKVCEQPIKEKYFLSGLLEPTNEAYAAAKIAGIKMCQAYNRQYKTNYICPIATNTYGPNDTFDEKDSHVIPALIKRFYEAKKNNLQSINIWGTGKPIRDFIYVDDLADAFIFLMNEYNSGDIINVSTGKEVSIEELVSCIKEVIGYKGKIIYDETKPDGAMKKVLDVSKMKALKWTPNTSLKEGVEKTCEWYLKMTNSTCPPAGNLNDKTKTNDKK